MNLIAVSQWSRNKQEAQLAARFVPISGCLEMRSCMTKIETQSDMLCNQLHGCK